MFSRSISTKNLSFVSQRRRLIPYEPILIPFRALFSTHMVGDRPMLVRDFIHSALYDAKHGYFSQLSRSVGVLERSIRFNQLEGRKAYIDHLDKIYKQSDISWFTPVELFKVIPFKQTVHSKGRLRILPSLFKPGSKKSLFPCIHQKQHVEEKSFYSCVRVWNFFLLHSCCKACLFCSLGMPTGSLKP
uniref:Uncharacterized protein MANES_15G053200 n=1 Tax=Rhizophora mucronata TaxID=61149 RepID=A0A2P2LFL8_RHIMU